MKNKPTYAIDSVDSALLLATLLQQEGPMRVTGAAERLGVSVSTAHRVLGMLVYRDFAEQLPDKRYGPGPLMRAGSLQQGAVARLRQTALPYLRRLAAELSETANLMVLVDTEVRFVATIECAHPLRVGDRTGRSLPAHRSSGGKALLAILPEPIVTASLDSLDSRARTRLQRELRTTRRVGFALNREETEAGLSAVGVAVPLSEKVPPAAMSLAMPTVRYSREQLPGWASALSEAAGAVAAELEMG